MSDLSPSYHTVCSVLGQQWEQAWHSKQSDTLLSFIRSHLPEQQKQQTEYQNKEINDDKSMRLLPRVLSSAHEPSSSTESPSVQYGLRRPHSSVVHTARSEDENSTDNSMEHEKDIHQFDVQQQQPTQRRNHSSGQYKKHDLDRYLGFHQFGAFYPLLTMDKSGTDVYALNNPYEPINVMDIILPHSFDLGIVSEIMQYEDASFPSMPESKLQGFSLSTQLDIIYTFCHKICPKAVACLDEVAIHVTISFVETANLLDTLKQRIQESIDLPNVTVYVHIHKVPQNDLDANEKLYEDVQSWMQTRTGIPNIKSFMDSHQCDDASTLSDTRHERKESTNCICREILETELTTATPTTTTTMESTEATGNHRRRVFVLHHDYAHQVGKQSFSTHKEEYIADMFDYFCKHVGVQRLHHAFLMEYFTRRRFNAHLFFLQYPLDHLSHEIQHIKQWLHAASYSGSTTECQTMSGGKTNPHVWMWCLVRYVQIAYPLLYPMYLYAHRPDLEDTILFVLTYSQYCIFSTWDEFERFIIVLRPILSCPQLFFSAIDDEHCQRAIDYLWNGRFSQQSNATAEQLQTNVGYLVNQLYCAYMYRLGLTISGPNVQNTYHDMHSNISHYLCTLYGNQTNATQLRDSYIDQILQPLSSTASRRIKIDTETKKADPNDQQLSHEQKHKDNRLRETVREIIQSQSDGEINNAIQSLVHELASSSSAEERYITHSDFYKCYNLLGMLSHFGYPYSTNQLVDLDNGLGICHTTGQSEKVPRYHTSYCASDKGIESLLGLMFCLYTLGQNEQREHSFDIGIPNFFVESSSSSSSKNRLVVCWSELQKKWKARFFTAWKSFFQHPTFSFPDGDVFTADHVIGDTEMAVLRLAEEVVIRGPSFLDTLSRKNE